MRLDLPRQIVSKWRKRSFLSAWADYMICQGAEFEYKRGGALACIASLDVHQASLFGLCEKTKGR